MMNDFEKNLVELTHLLEGRKRENGTVLLIGARAGGLFRSTELYEDIAQLFIDSNAFSESSRPQQFSKSYGHLKGATLNESDTHTHLINWLRNIVPSKADYCLVELIKAGFFSTVLTTNIDDIIDEAFKKRDMRERRDYQVFVHRPVTGDKTSTSSRIDYFVNNKLHKVVKVFGDLASHDYQTVGHEFHPEDDQHFKEYLLRTLKRDVLVVGFDNQWDAGIELAIPHGGDSLWYIDEEAPVPESVIDKALKYRKGKIITGENGSYENFMEILHSRLIENNERDYGLKLDISDLASDLDELQLQVQQLRSEVTAQREREFGELQLQVQQLRHDMTILRAEVGRLSSLPGDLSELIALIKEKG